MHENAVTGNKSLWDQSYSHRVCRGLEFLWQLYVGSEHCNVEKHDSAQWDYSREGPSCTGQI